MSSNTLWEKKEQTEGKHQVLSYYLDSWFPILGSKYGRILYIDGFAGPGKYIGGEPGSPLIALRIIRKYKQISKLKDVEIICLFMEADINRAKHLEAILEKYEDIPNVKWYVFADEFDKNMTNILDYLEEQEQFLAPSFVMIDPFGIKGSRMELFRRILSNPRSECLITFMYEYIQRFHETPQYEPHLNELFGTSQWKDCLKIEDSSTKKQFLHELFKNQLKEFGAKYVVYFELWKGGRHKHTLYFATGHLKGCDLMKQAIWSADPSGNFAIKGYEANQQIRLKPDMELLAKQLRDHFGNTDTPVEEIEKFVMSDKTIFHSHQLRNNTLKPLEQEDRIRVTRPISKRGFPNNKGITIKFH